MPNRPEFETEIDEGEEIEKIEKEERLTRSIFGPDAPRLNIAKARRLGFRIFRAWHSCGCCQTDMAFLDATNARREFDPGTAQFADSVRDDMGSIYEAVNTYRGFEEVLNDCPAPRHEPVNFPGEKKQFKTFSKGRPPTNRAPANPVALVP